MQQRHEGPLALTRAAKQPWQRFALLTVFSKPNPKDEQFSSRLKSG
jgi:hypothetical protein